MRGRSKIAAVIGVGQSDYIGDHEKVRAGGKPHVPSTQLAQNAT